MKLSELTSDNISTLTADELLALHRSAHRVAQAAEDPEPISATHSLLVTAMQSKSLNHNSPLTIVSPNISGLYIKSPHGMLIYEGKKTAVVQPKLDDAIPGEHVICSKEDGTAYAYGVAHIAQPVPVLHEEFNNHFNQHRVTIAECEKWWASCDTLYLYPITLFSPYSTPRPIEIEPGVQMIMDEVKFIETPILEKIAQEEQPMPWKPSDAQSHTRAADTPKKQAQWAEVANSALARCLKDGGEKAKCEASAVRQANAVVSGKTDKNLSDTLIALSPECPDCVPDSKAAEPNQTSCTCPNCGAEVDHEPGTPCSEVKCPDCDSMMRGGGSDDEKSLSTFSLFRRKDGTGPTYLVLWTTNSYKDREKEIFTTASIKDYVARYANEPTKGEFWYAHMPGTKFGTIIWQDIVADRFLVQLGTFDDTPVGNAFKTFFTKHPTSHPVIAPMGWGASHGYNYVAADRNDGVYDWFNTIESSVLPMHRAANIHNPHPTIIGGKQMDEKSRAELRTISTEIGEDLEQLINATAEQRKSELDSVVEHKNVDAETEVTPEPDTEQAVESDAQPLDTGSTTEKAQTEPAPEPVAVTLSEEQITAVITKAAEVFGLPSLSDAIANLTAKVETLEKQQGETNAKVDKLSESDEKKVADKVQSLPNFAPLSFSWLRPSQAPQTKLTESDTDLQKSVSKGKVPEALVRLAQSQNK